MTPKPVVDILEWWRDGGSVARRGVFVEAPDGFMLTDAIADRLRAVLYGEPVPQTPILATDTPFDVFWRAYPRKVAKVLAAKAWKRLPHRDGLFDQIMAALERQKRTEQWQKDGGQFVPHPATWLNQQRWLDEIGPAAPVTPDASQERARSIDVIKQRAALLRGERA